MPIAYLTPSTAPSFDVVFPASGAHGGVTVDGGNASDKYFVAACGFRDANGHAITGMTLNGVAMTALGVAVSGNGAYLRLFGLATGSGNMGSVSLVATVSGGVGTQDGVISFMVFSGVAQTSSLDGYNPNSNTTGGASLAITSATGDVAFWFVNFRGFSGDSVNVGSSSYTERVDNLNGTGGSLVVMGGGEAAGAATVNFSAALSGGTSNGWAAAGANLNVAAAGNTSPSTPTCTVADNDHDSVDLTGSAFSDSDVGNTHAASQWQVDEDGGDFSSPVADSGEDATNLTSRTLTGLSASTAYDARVRYMDSSGDAGTKWSSWSAVASFTTDAPPNTPPTATITSPTTGTSIPTGGALTLTGTGSDSEDGAITGTGLEWDSSIDGALGTGGSLLVNLTNGVHTITLTATDSDTDTGTDDIQVNVGVGGGGTILIPTRSGRANLRM